MAEGVHGLPDSGHVNSTWTLRRKLWPGADPCLPIGPALAVARAEWVRRGCWPHRPQATPGSVLGPSHAPLEDKAWFCRGEGCARLGGSQGDLAETQDQSRLRLRTPSCGSGMPGGWGAVTAPEVTYVCTASGGQGPHSLGGQGSAPSGPLSARLGLGPPATRAQNAFIPSWGGEGEGPEVLCPQGGRHSVTARPPHQALLPVRRSQRGRDGDTENMGAGRAFTPPPEGFARLRFPAARLPPLSTPTLTPDLQLLLHVPAVAHPRSGPRGVSHGHLGEPGPVAQPDTLQSVSPSPRWEAHSHPPQGALAKGHPPQCASPPDSRAPGSVGHPLPVASCHSWREPSRHPPAQAPAGGGGLAGAALDPGTGAGGLGGQVSRPARLGIACARGSTFELTWGFPGCWCPRLVHRGKVGEKGSGSLCALGPLLLPGMYLSASFQLRLRGASPAAMGLRWQPLPRSASEDGALAWSGTCASPARSTEGASPCLPSTQD